MSRDYAADAEDAKTRGNEALSAKNFDQAIQWYTQALELVKKVPPPSNKHVYLSNRSAAYLSKGYAETALKDANEAVAVRPDWPKGYVRQGAALHALHKYGDAAKVYEDALAKFPDDAALKSGLEAVLEERESVLHGSRSSSGFPPSLEGLFQDPVARAKLSEDPRTSAYMKDASFTRMLDAVATSPDMLAVYLQQDERMATALSVLLNVDIRARAGEDRDAAPAAAPKPTPEELKERREREERERVAVMSPEERAAFESRKRADEHKERGNAHYKKHEFEAALECFARAIEEQPSNMTYYLNRASVYLEQARFEDAVRACDDALEVGRANQAPYESIAKAYERRGNVFLKKGELSEALAEYKRAQLEFRQTSLDEKVRQLERQLRQKAEKEYEDPAKAVEAKERGNAKFKAGDWVGAVAEYTEAIKRDPTCAVYRVNRAAALTKLCDFGGALDDAEHAIKLDPKYVKAWARHGKIEQFAKKYHRAVASYSKGLELDPDDAECLEGMRQVEGLIVEQNEENPELRQQRALEDPEIRSILQDPVIMGVLRDMKEDPKSARVHLANEGVRGKIEKLVQAGILKVG